MAQQLDLAQALDRISELLALAHAADMDWKTLISVTRKLWSSAYARVDILSPSERWRHEHT